MKTLEQFVFRFPQNLCLKLSEIAEKYQLVSLEIEMLGSDAGGCGFESRAGLKPSFCLQK